MIFNDFCRIVEKKIIPEFYDDDFEMLKMAHLFEINSIFNSVNKKKFVTIDNADHFIFLPFTVTALYDAEYEYSNSEPLYIFYNEENCFGRDCKFGFVAVDKSVHENNSYMNIFRGTILNFRLVDEGKDKGASIGFDIGLGTFGTIMTGDDRFYDFTEDLKKPTDEFNEYMPVVTEAIGKAFHKIIKINTIDNIIIESKLRKPPKPRKGKLLRKHERPEYVVVKSKEVRRYMGLPEYFTDAKTGRKKPYPHPVKAHPRTLNRGTEYERITHIPAYHTGERESIKGNRKYRVLLDREDFK